MICLDANVFVSAARPEEVNFSTSVRLLARFRAENVPLCSSVLLLAEVAGAVARRTGNVAAGFDLARALQRFPNLTFLALDEALATQASHIAATLRLRGADAVYVATAERAGATLVTWDSEVVARAWGVGGVVRVETPAGWLASAA